MAKCIECSKEIPPAKLRWKGVHQTKKYCSRHCAQKHSARIRNFRRL